MFLVTSPIVINVPTRGLLAVETMHAIVWWLANLNIKRNMTSMSLLKIAGFWSKSGQNAVRLIPTGPPTAPKQPKSPSCWDRGEKEGRRREKSKICTPSLYIGYFGEKTTWNFLLRARFRESAQINNLHLARKHARIFVRLHCLFREANSFLEELIMSKDKYPSIFLKPNQWRLLCFTFLYISLLFCAKHKMTKFSFFFFNFDAAI